MATRQRTYVVTGGASGIGAATAELVAARGHRVITADLHDADIRVDLATDAGRTRLATDVADRTGGVIDAVIAAAGTARQGVTDVKVNYFGAVATLSGLRPLLAEGDHPRAVAIASYAVVRPHSDDMVAACLAGDEAAATSLPVDDLFAVYSSSKRALARWVRRQAITDAWAGAEIALNAVAPGIVRTAMTADMLADDALAAHLHRAVPMPYGGVAEPGVVAELLAFLTSAEAQSITGQTVFVDGGADCVVRGDDVF
jgi:NAD(P)-dependent dehydrogenase (short-subunit alcohol dehydrogenase family)